jgi:hypothetical protein
MEPSVMQMLIPGSRSGGRREGRLEWLRRAGLVGVDEVPGDAVEGLVKRAEVTGERARVVMVDGDGAQDRSRLLPVGERVGEST